MHQIMTSGQQSIFSPISEYYYIHLDDAAEKAKKEKEKTKPPSRIPGLRDASKKMSKIVSF